MKKKKTILLIDLDLEAFVRSYLATAAWVTCDSDECQEFTRNAKNYATTDCLNFINKVANKFGKEKANQLLTIDGKDVPYLAAFDFFLSRNHHGSGFFDRTEEYNEEERKALTEISHRMGGTDCYHMRGKKSKLCFD